MSTLEPNGQFDGADEPAEQAVSMWGAVELAMRGMSYRAIGDELKVSDATVRRILNGPEGQRLLREARDEYLGRTGRMMSSLGMVALQSLGQILVSETTGTRDRIAAASKILDLQHRHAITIEGVQPGQTVIISHDTDDLTWLHERARQVRQVIETSVHEGLAIVEEPTVISETG